MVRTIHNFDFENKNVLVRVDFNVPLNDEGKVADDIRIKESLVTIDEIIDKHGIPVLMSHFGRPKGERKSEFSLRPVADHLRNKYGYIVHFAEDCIGKPAKEAISKANHGDIVLLENVRFYPEEEKDEIEFAKKLAELGDVYVNDAFGSAHRAHASTHAVASLFEPENRLAGNLMLSEIEYLGNAVTNPGRPFVAILGGAKISGKIDVIKSLMDKCDSIIIGGGMMYTFYKALGYNIGNSLLEEDRVNMAKEIMDTAERKNIRLLLPVDTLVAKEFANESVTKVTEDDEIPEGWVGVDIGPESQRIFANEIATAKTIVWNGPMGVFEMDNFAKGTYSIAQALADATSKGAITIVGGGDSAAAVKKMKFDKKVSHVSTGGGASLEYLEGKKLPGVSILDA